MRGRLRALSTCLICAWVGTQLNVAAVAFPLTITVLIEAQSPERSNSHALYISHCASVAGCWVVMETVRFLGFTTTDSAIFWAVGSVALLLLQRGPITHPPAFASGGAVMIGLDPLALIAAIFTAWVLSSIYKRFRWY